MVTGGSQQPAADNQPNNTGVTPAAKADLLPQVRSQPVGYKPVHRARPHEQRQRPSERRCEKKISAHPLTLINE